MFLIRIGTRLLKGSLFQSLVPQRKAILVPVQQLHSVTAAVAKDKQSWLDYLESGRVGRFQLTELENESALVQGGVLSVEGSLLTKPCKTPYEMSLLSVSSQPANSRGISPFL